MKREDREGGRRAERGILEARGKGSGAAVSENMSGSSKCWVRRGISVQTYL